MTKKYRYKIIQERLERFAKINEVMHEMTAYAEGQLYSSFEDLSLMQIHVLRIINFHKPCRMSQIAKSADLTMGSITQIVDKLIRKKYVKRIRSNSDRRVVHAELTAKGKKVTAASKQQIMLVAQHIMSKFTEQDQEKFLDFFSKVIEKE